MRILAIDYGQKKVGLALATSMLAEPYKVIRFNSFKTLTNELKEIIDTERIEKVIIGISDGEMGKESREFGKRLGAEIGISVYFQDETLTTHNAQELSLEAGIKRKKRKEMEDAYSAALILQDYLDLN